MRRRRFARYPDCFGHLSIQGLCDCASRHGMLLICAYKPGMHVYNEIGLYGTAEQMKATEQEWAAAGHKLKPRGFRSVMGVPLSIQRDKWISVQLQRKVAEVQA